MTSLLLFLAVDILLVAAKQLPRSLGKCEVLSRASFLAGPSHYEFSDIMKMIYCFHLVISQTLSLSLSQGKLKVHISRFLMSFLSTDISKKKKIILVLVGPAKANLLAPGRCVCRGSGGTRPT